MKANKVSKLKRIAAAAAMTMAMAGTMMIAMPQTARADSDDYTHVQRYDRGEHRGWFQRERGDIDDQRYLCDRDGDDCRPNPYYEGSDRYQQNYSRGDDWSRANRWIFPW